MLMTIAKCSFKEVMMALNANFLMKWMETDRISDQDKNQV